MATATVGWSLAWVSTKNIKVFKKYWGDQQIIRGIKKSYSLEWKAVWGERKEWRKEARKEASKQGRKQARKGGGRETTKQLSEEATDTLHGGLRSAGSFGLSLQKWRAKRRGLHVGSRQHMSILHWNDPKISFDPPTWRRRACSQRARWDPGWRATRAWCARCICVSQLFFLLFSCAAWNARCCAGMAVLRDVRCGSGHDCAVRRGAAVAITWLGHISEEDRRSLAQLGDREMFAALLAARLIRPEPKKFWFALFLKLVHIVAFSDCWLVTVWRQVLPPAVRTGPRGDVKKGCKPGWVGPVRVIFHRDASTWRSRWSSTSHCHTPRDAASRVPQQGCPTLKSLFDPLPRRTFQDGSPLT